MAAVDFVELLIAIAFLLPGCALLTFAVRTSRRWLRVVLALCAAFYLLIYAVMLMFSVAGDDHETGMLGYITVGLSALVGLSSLGCLVVAFRPINRRA